MMSKFFGLLLPYVIIILGLGMNMGQMNVIVSSSIIGILLSVWLFAIMKSEGTSFMRLGLIFNMVLNVMAIILGTIDSKLAIYHVIPLLIIMVCLECLAYYILHKNKPAFHMSYQYSYKNNHRRYF